MRKLFRTYSLAILTGLAVFFLAVIVGYYTWGVGYLLTIEAGTSQQYHATNETPQFNLQAAAQLDYRGTTPAIGN